MFSGYTHTHAPGGDGGGVMMVVTMVMVVVMGDAGYCSQTTFRAT